MKRIFVLGVACATGSLVAASPADDDWALQTKYVNDELAAEFNPAFGAKAVGTIDHHLIHWASVHEMVGQCQSNGPGSMCLQTIGQIVAVGKRYQSSRDGLKSVKTVTCHDGHEDKVTITPTAIDMEFKSCDIVPYSTQQSAKALLAAFPRLEFEQGQTDIKAELLAFGDSCNTEASITFDPKFDIKAWRAVYGPTLSMGDLCKPALQFAGLACTQNPKIKAALTKVKKVVCTDTGAAADWTFKLAGDTFTEVLSKAPVSHRTENRWLENTVPGAKPAWTVDRQTVERD